MEVPNSTIQEAEYSAIFKPSKINRQVKNEEETGIERLIQLRSNYSEQQRVGPYFTVEVWANLNYLMVLAKE